MSLFGFLSFVRGKKHPSKARGQRPRSFWNKHILALEQLETRTVPSTLEFSATLPITATDFTEVLSLPQFDTQGGYRALDSVAIVVHTQIDTSTSGSLTNNGSSTSTYRAQLDGTNTASGPGITPLTSTVHTDTGPISVPGHTTVTIPPTTDSDLQVEDVTLTSGLGAFLGTGTVDYQFDASVSSSISVAGGANLSQNVAFDTDGQGSVDITYDYHLAEPDIQIIKLTNGTDNDSPTGPHIKVGDPVTWTYNVTNPGNVPLSDVAVTDDNGTPGTTSPATDDDFLATTVFGDGSAGQGDASHNKGDVNNNELLDVGETWAFTASGIAEPGQYSNVGTAIGTPANPDGTPIDNPNIQDVTATNPDNYFGDAPAIQIVKLTNGTNNDTAPGLHVPAGSAITWTYNVTATGSNVPLTNVTVTDNIAGVNPTPVLSGGFNTGDTNTDGKLEAGETWVFTASGTAVTGQYTNVGTASGTDAFIPGNTVSASNPDNYFGDAPAIQIVKLTNGTNNDTAPGLHVPAGSAITWTYNVTATGSNVPLTNVTVTDNIAGVNPTPVLSGGFNTGDTNTDGKLEAGETWVFTASGTAVTGQYTNVGTATGTDAFIPGNTVSASNPDNYFGDAPAIQIVKLTNGTNNDTAPGLHVPAGSAITWTYNVTATGSNVPLTNVTVTDNIAGVNPTPVLSGGFNTGDTNTDGKLEAGETWVFTASGTAVTGQYTNVGTATGTDAFIPGNTVSASNPDNYFGDAPAIQIVKLTNGTNNDTAPGLHVPAGSAITWTYNVTATGSNVPLTNVTVTDNIAGVNPTPVLSGGFNTGDTNTDGKLEAGETWVFTASGTAVTGQYTNVGTATGTDAFIPGNTVSASNPDNYFGDAPAIQIVKLTNGTNNDTAPGLHVPAGSAITWTYNVTATGSNVPLTNVTVTDNIAGVNPTPVLSGGFNTGDTNTDGKLEAGETWVFTASGTAVTGQYTNVGTASGTDAFIPGNTVSASNPDNYFGDAPACDAPILVYCNDIPEIQPISFIGKIQLISSNVVAANGTLAEENAFVGGVYQKLLGRDPDISGLTNWVMLLQEGGTRDQVARGIWDSAEHRGLEVDHFYEFFLHRESDPNGRAGWVNALLAGVGEDTVMVDFLTSGEYLSAHASNSAFVSGLYQDLLGRIPDANGNAGWVALLNSGVGRDVVARDILTSEEGRSRNLVAFYDAFLDRSPDAAGQQAWLVALANGTTLRDVAISFLASNEFFGLAKKVAG